MKLQWVLDANGQWLLRDDKGRMLGYLQSHCGGGFMAFRVATGRYETFPDYVESESTRIEECAFALAKAVTQ
jgi:hypothetical protein